MLQRYLLFIIWLGCTIANMDAVADEDAEFFESKIRPVLVRECYECHSSASDEVKGDLLVDFRKGLRGGGESGPAVVPGKPEESILLEAIRYESSEMPPAGKLPEKIIADFERWIRQGAFDPRDKAPSRNEAADLAWKANLEDRSRWWSLQPLKDISPPAINNSLWAREPVDRFVNTKRDEAGLSPSPSADAVTLLRRISFVLTGLPPTPQQVEEFPVAFAADAETALADLVDRLLASPQFGERFARRWMDVVRYTDTYGYEWDNPVKGSWEYRDYLIRAFNDDIGFDQLIREQIAGDLLPNPRINSKEKINESLIGPVFYNMGEHRHGSSLQFNGIHQDMVNNKIDAFSKAFLAMTVACARCHDHKLDAISQADYYALAGVFMTPRWSARVIDSPGKNAAIVQKLKQLRQDIHHQLAKQWEMEIKEKLSDELQRWAEENSESIKNVKMESIAYPILKLSSASDANIQKTWEELATGWQAERTRRVESNRAKFKTLSDFSQLGFPPGWVSEGDGIRHGYVQAGTPLVSLQGESLIQKLLQRGYHTHAISSKLPGAVRMPAQQEIEGRYVSLMLNGGEWAGTLVVPQNAIQTETIKFFASTAPPQWVAFADNGLKNGVRRVLCEVATSSLNTNFPPRTGLARAGKVSLPNNDDGFNKRSWFSLTGIVTHDAPGVPADRLDSFVSLYAGDSPSNKKEAWQQVAKWFSDSVERWATHNATPEDVKRLNWLLEQKLLSNQQKQAPRIAVSVKRYREIEAHIQFARTANSMDERQIHPFDYRLNVRGNVDVDGPAIPRDFLEVFAGQNSVGKSRQSGRLELAQYLSSPKNPLTARVYVNRIWQSVFGTGIVSTSNDFGKLGDRPSHPELLDWLARQFMNDGWSTKKMIRRLVLSQTFRQSSTFSKAAADRDPMNRLLHHYPTRRLEAEEVRDALLMVSGRLDTTLYGKPINPPRFLEDSAKRLFSGPLDGNGRRSIYLKMSIMDPPKFLICFNLPDLKLPTGKRDVTNVPTQSLALLNDPLTLYLAEHWAERLMEDGSSEPEIRIRMMFIQALGRLPQKHELKRWSAAATSFSKSDNLMKDKTAWAELAHTFFNTKEFLYYK